MESCGLATVLVIAGVVALAAIAGIVWAAYSAIAEYDAMLRK